MISKKIVGVLKYLHITINIVMPIPSKNGIIPIDLNIYTPLPLLGGMIALEFLTNNVSPSLGTSPDHYGLGAAVIPGLETPPIQPLFPAQFILPKNLTFRRSPEASLWIQ